MHNRFATTLVACVVLLGSVRLPARLSEQGAAGWYKFRGDLRNSGRSTGQGAVGQVLWAFPTGATEMWSSPVLGPEGTLLVGAGRFRVGAGAEAGAIYALNAATGEVRWTTPTEDGVSGTPAVGADGRAFIGIANGDLLTLDARTGETLWKTKLADRQPIGTISVGADGSVYTTATSLYRVEPKTGKAVWRQRDGMYWRASPARDGERLYTSGGGWVRARLASTGRTIWERALPSSSDASPTVSDDGTVYVLSDYALTLNALDGATGRRRWWLCPPDEEKGIERVPGSPAIGRDGTIFFGTSRGRFLAVDGRSGETRWMKRFGCEIVSSPALDAAGVLYFGGLNGTLYALDSRDGAVKWTVQTGGPIHTSPAVGPDGMVYVASHDGKVYAIR